MNPFEKIFNYRLLSRLDDSGTFMVTSHERQWLKTMLRHPSAADAFSPGTLEKLRSILGREPFIETAVYVTEKARSADKQLYHPMLRPLRRCLQRSSGVCLTYSTKGGQIVSGQTGMPFKLEYSMVKKEWYLLWYHLRHRALMSTRLQKIVSVSDFVIPPDEAERIRGQIARMLDSRKTDALIEVVPAYNRELSRILYAFSCFEKDVEYDPAAGLYRIRVSFLGDESEYLLSKLRFLGKRVRVVQGDYLQKRMHESATKALARYGIVPDAEGREEAAAASETPEG